MVRRAVATWLRMEPWAPTKRSAAIVDASCQRPQLPRVNVADAQSRRHRRMLTCRCFQLLALATEDQLHDEARLLATGLRRPVATLRGDENADRRLSRYQPAHARQSVRNPGARHRRPADFS